MISHAEPDQPVTGMQDQRDHRKADPVVDRGNELDVAHRGIDRAPGDDDQEIQQNEAVTIDLRAPESGATVGDVDADLNGQRSRLSSAARQFRDLLVERQRCKLQALDRGQIWEYRVGDLLYGQSATDRHDCGLDTVGAFRSEDMGA